MALIRLGSVRRKRKKKPSTGGYNAGFGSYRYARLRYRQKSGTRSAVVEIVGHKVGALCVREVNKFGVFLDEEVRVIETCDIVDKAFMIKDSMGELMAFG